IGGVSHLFGTPAFAAAPAEEEESNVLITQDGMAFEFFLPTNYADQIAQLKNQNADYKAPKRSISKICPNFKNDKNYFDAASNYDWENNCYVNVDLDGFGKNSTGFDDFSRYEDFINAGDMQMLGFSGTGEVRPVYDNGNPDAAINNGYKYLYGAEALEKVKEDYAAAQEDYCEEHCSGEGQHANDCCGRCYECLV
nr:hypothetical protein [bacterium]